MAKKTLTFEEARELIGVRKRQFSNLVKAKTLETVEVSAVVRELRITRASAEAYATRTGPGRPRSVTRNPQK